jgi:hypothetical protein
MNSKVIISAACSSLLLLVTLLISAYVLGWFNSEGDECQPGPDASFKELTERWAYKTTDKESEMSLMSKPLVCKASECKIGSSILDNVCYLDSETQSSPPPLASDIDSDAELPSDNGNDSDAELPSDNGNDTDEKTDDESVEPEESQNTPGSSSATSAPSPDTVSRTDKAPLGMYSMGFYFERPTDWPDVGNGKCTHSDKAKIQYHTDCGEGLDGVPRPPVSVCSDGTLIALFDRNWDDVVPLQPYANNKSDVKTKCPKAWTHKYPAPLTIAEKNTMRVGRMNLPHHNNNRSTATPTPTPTATNTPKPSGTCVPTSSQLKEHGKTYAYKANGTCAVETCDSGYYVSNSRCLKRNIDSWKKMTLPTGGFRGF